MHLFRVARRPLVRWRQGRWRRFFLGPVHRPRGSCPQGHASPQKGCKCARVRTNSSLFKCTSEPPPPHRRLHSRVTVLCCFFANSGGCRERKSSARDALSRIKREYPPRAKMSWPLPATATEELLEWPVTAPVNVASSN